MTMRKSKWPLLFFWIVAAPIFGAFLTDIDAALARAKLEKKPLLISFYGIWCPPCNELEEVVFESAPFLKSAGKFVLLKVDADAESSWRLKDRYRVGGYPTVVFATSVGKEIYRVVGFRTVQEFMRTMSWVHDNRGLDLEKACMKASTAALWHCGFTCSEKADDACASTAFHKLESRLKTNDPKLHFIKSHFARRLKNADEKRVALDALLKRYPQSPFAYLWASDIVGAEDVTPPVQDRLRPMLTPVLGEYEKILKHPQLELTGLAPTDIAQIRAEILEKLGDAEPAKLAWKAAATMLAELSKQLPANSAARGYTLERIGCLDSAGERGAALELSNEYRQRYPKEFTFHFRAASILKKMSKLEEAIGPARDAYSNSYGDNRIRSATLLISILAANSDKASAKGIYADMKAIARPDAKLEVRTHRYWKALDEAYSKM